MPGRIEDYALIGNCETIALVGRDGSIDWLGLPRFDSPACFAALLGEPKHGRWLIAPADVSASVSRSYCDDTLILETVFRTGSGAVRLTDFMIRRDRAADVVRIVTGLEGEVAMRMELIVRFDYGSVVPWVSKQQDGRLQFIAGPDQLLLEATVEMQGEDHRTIADFTVGAGEEKSFSLTWSPSFSEPPAASPIAETLSHVKGEWSDWARTFNTQSEWRGPVLRSLLTLKSLAHWETGRDRGGWNDISAGTVRRRTQLGLPILLASGLHIHPARPDRRGLSRRSEGLASMAATRRRRVAGRRADDVRRRGRTTARRIHRAMAARL